MPLQVAFLTFKVTSVSVCGLFLLGRFVTDPPRPQRTVEGPDQVLVESLILLTDQARAGRRGDPMVASSFAHGEWHEAIPSSTLGCRIHWPWGSQGAVARRVELQDPQRGSVDQLRHLRSPVWGTAWSSAGFAGLHGELIYRIPYTKGLSIQSL